MEKREQYLPVSNNRNITAPDSEDGGTNEDHEFSLPADGERNEYSDHHYDESTQPRKVVTSRHDHTEDDVPLPPMPIMNLEDPVGRTFLLDQKEDGQKF